MVQLVLEVQLFLQGLLGVGLADVEVVLAGAVVFGRWGFVEILNKYQPHCHT